MPRFWSGCMNLQLSWYLHLPFVFQWQQTMVLHFSRFLMASAVTADAPEALLQGAALLVKVGRISCASSDASEAVEVCPEP